MAYSFRKEKNLDNEETKTEIIEDSHDEITEISKENSSEDLKTQEVKKSAKPRLDIS